MGALDGRVAVVTGAGRGLGREHALLLAREGAKVVVNDHGGASDGSGGDRSVAQQVVDEIEAAGGEAVTHTGSVSDWHDAQRLVQTALDSFGDLHVLVNNAGIIRDRMIVNMSEQDWDDVVDVHLKGTFAVTRHAATYWRARAKETGSPVSASVVCTSSGSGLMNNVGQANYGAAKAGIAGFAQICAKELARYGVRVNTITPLGRTRMTEQTPGLADQLAPAPGGFDPYDPANVSPLVAYLASEQCPYTGGVWGSAAGTVFLHEGWRVVAGEQSDGRWHLEELAEAVPRFVAGRETARWLLSEAPPPP